MPMAGMFGVPDISGWVPDFRAGYEQLRAQSGRLKALRGWRIEGTWAVLGANLTLPGLRAGMPTESGCKPARLACASSAGWTGTASAASHQVPGRTGVSSPCYWPPSWGLPSVLSRRSAGSSGVVVQHQVQVQVLRDG